MEEITSPIWSSFILKGSTAELTSWRVAAVLAMASSRWIRPSRPATSVTAWGDIAAAGLEKFSMMGAPEAAGAKEGAAASLAAAGCGKARWGSRDIPSAAAAGEPILGCAAAGSSSPDRVSERRSICEREIGSKLEEA